MQVQKLREAAQSRFESILTSIEGWAPQPASFSGQDAPSKALQQRLEKAIQALQDGLVERDTEVDTCTCLSMIVCLYVWIPVYHYKCTWNPLRKNMAVCRSAYCFWLR